MKLGHTIPMKGGAEYDAFTRFRRYCAFKSGERAWLKRKYWKRDRAQAKAEVLAEMDRRISAMIGRDNGFNS